MADDDPAVMECGFCLQKDSALVEPKLLQCSHAHCFECLTANFNTNGVVRCPTCSEVYDVTPEDLPAASSVADDFPCCDICAKKCLADEPAVTYCTSCCKKYCAKHRELHDQLEDHTKIGINEYRTQAKKLEVRNCSDHNQPFALGCKMCLAIICVQCTSGVLETCTHGKDHKLIPLEELVGELMKEMHDLQSKLASKEEKFDGLFKKTSEGLADYETATQEMVGRIHRTRDAQIESIKKKYEDLERQLVEQRAKCKSAMTVFMEEDVGLTLADLSKRRMKIEARVNHSHQVDFAEKYQEMKDIVLQLLDKNVPAFQLKKCAELYHKGMSRDIELAVVFSNGFIDSENGLRTLISTPKSARYLDNVKLESRPISATHYHGNTYVGLEEGTVCKINECYQLSDSIENIGGAVFGVEVYQDKIYTLVYGQPCTVHIYGLKGQRVSSWNHQNECYGHNDCAIVADQIVIPDRVNKKFTVYSLSGQTIKSIPFPAQIIPNQGSNSYKSICDCGDDSVVAADCTSNQVFRMNISTGNVIWTSALVSGPLAVTRYGGRSILVSSENSNKLTFLDIETGYLLSTIVVEGLSSNTRVFDLAVYGNTLAIPAYDNMEILFYKLK